MARALFWILVVSGSIALAPYFIFFIVAVLFGGMSFGVAALLIWMSAGQQGLDQSLVPVMVGGVLSAVFVIYSLTRTFLHWMWEQKVLYLFDAA